MTPNQASQGLDDLYCSVTQASTDDDGDLIYYSYSWQDPSSVVQQTTSMVTDVEDIFLASGTSTGNWHCTVTPNDGIDDGPLGSSNSIDVIPGNCNINPNGTLLISSSEFCDDAPPSGWTQCAGWYNTSGNDVSVWRSWGYLGGSITKVVSTHWTGGSGFFTSTGGGSACYFNSGCGIDAPCGTLTLGTGSASSIILAPGGDNDFELRISCNGAALNDRIIGVYK